MPTLQPVGGKLDGAYGVVAGLEVIQALNDAGIKTLRPIEVVAWTNEEGSRFASGAMGSSTFVDPTRLANYRESIEAHGVSGVFRLSVKQKTTLLIAERFVQDRHVTPCGGTGSWQRLGKLLDPSIKVKNAALEPHSQKKWHLDSNVSFLIFVQKMNVRCTQERAPDLGLAEYHERLLTGVELGPR